jgi:uncharacterized protein with HEPN domain
MRPEARKYLWDAEQAAEEIERYLSGKVFNDYRADSMLRSAVERQFEIIGEALNQLSKLDPKTAASIPELARIVAFRNVLIHGYATVNHDLVWQAATDKLPALKRAIIELRARDVAS